MRLTRYGNRPLTDPDAVEDVEFLLALDVPIEQIAKRCNVGVAALYKKYPQLRPARAKAS